MTVVVVLLAIVVGLLAVLVVGLLRSHADILRRLQALDGAVPGGRPLAPGTVPPAHAPAGRPAHDLEGAHVGGGTVALRVVGAAQGTLLLFLSSGCLTCRDFWEAAADPGGMTVPPGTRVVVVARGTDQESPSALADLAGPATTLVLSSRAWDDYGVPGSPYAVLVDGPSGAVVGEGTGGNWEQVANLLAQATGDLAFAGETTPRARKARRDAAVERDTDAELLAAGLRPGDPSLYPAPAGTPEDDHLR